MTVLFDSTTDPKNGASFTTLNKLIVEFITTLTLNDTRKRFSGQINRN